MKTRSILLAAILTFSVVALVPGASAHSCYSTDDTCNQSCSGGNHDHTWHEGGQERSCSGSGPDPILDNPVCFVYLTVMELFPAVIGADLAIPPPCQTFYLAA